MPKHLHTSFKNQQTFQDHVSGNVANFIGSMPFVYVHSVWFVIWILLNIGLLGVGLIFDQYPFGLLMLVVNLEVVFLSTFVLISQNQQARISELRSQLDYETDVKAEKEIEVVMETLERIAKRSGIDIGDLVTKIHTLHQAEKHFIEVEKRTQ